MATQNPTANYGWVLPTVGGSADAWGTILNALIGDDVNGIDAKVYAIRTDLTALQASAVNASNLSGGTIPAARVPEAAVTQHQAALSIAAAKVTAGAFGAGSYSISAGLAVGTTLTVGTTLGVTGAVTITSASATVGGNSVATVIASTEVASGAARDGTIWCQWS